MHDPLSLAFQVPNPFARRYPWARRWGERPPLLAVWHKDPEVCGEDDSCRLAYRYRHPEPDFRAHEEDYLTLEALECRHRMLRGHPWYNQLTPWRWHAWHWRLQVPLVLDLKRWLFSRCCRCGKRFPWGYAPTSCDWDGPGPRWFRGEPGVYHHGCRAD
jgi:hypothetical protein